MKTKLLFVKRRFLIVLLFALALMFACLIAGATTSVAYAAGEHTDHSGWQTLSGTIGGDHLSSTIVLTGDVSLDSDVTCSETIICLNGHTITGNGKELRMISNNLTICDCTGKGKIQNAIIGNQSSRKLMNLNNVTLVNSNIRVDCTINLNGVTMNGGQILTKKSINNIYINEGTVISGTTGIDSIGPIYISGGTVDSDLTTKYDSNTVCPLYISGGTVRGTINVTTNATCEISGGTFSRPINVSGGTCNITGGTFSSPINVSGGTCNITGGKISTSQYYTNDPGTPQGAVVVNAGGVCNIGGTAQITGNRVDYGGAVCVNGGTCTISGNNITKNNVTYGAVYVVDGTCNIEKDAVISGNNSSYNGGGVYMRNGTCNIRGTITDNYTASYCHGGGVYVLGGTCNISSTGTVKNNSATLCGGGVYVASGKCDIYGTVQGNKAKGGEGGGVYVAGGTCSIYAQSIIQKNTATHSGGGVYVADSQSVFIAGTIDSNIANENGGGVCLISNASLDLNGSIVNNSAATGSNPGNGGGIYCGSGCSLTLQSATVITGNKAYGQGGGIYLNGTAANPCTVTFSGNATVHATVNSNAEYRKGGTAYFNNVYALNSEITFNANALSSVQQNSIVLNTSSCTLAGGKWETGQIGPYFELQDGGEIIIAGGYYSTDPAQLFTIADTARVVQIDENSGDNNYDAAYPWAVYPVRFEYMSGWQNGSLVYDGQPIEKDTDFTLYLEYSYDDMPFYYWYKAQGADDSAYVLGLPADAGTYTVKVGALYLRSSYKEYWECTFDVAIAKADPSYTVPTNITVPLGDSLSAVQLPDGWTWQDGSIIPDTEGEQTFTIIFTPSDTNNYNIAEEQITVLVKQRVSGAVTDISDISRIYDDTAVSAPTFDSLSTGAAVIEYKEKDADDSTYTTTAPNTVGEYTVRVTVAADADYEEASATRDFSITYLPAPENPYTIINAIEGTNGWYRSTVTLKPAEGYTVATSLNGTYEARLIYNDYTDGVVIYLKNADGQMTDAITVGAVKIDKTAPDGDVKFAGNSVKEAFDEIDFWLFFNKNLDVEIVATDEESGAAKIEYFKSDKVLTEEEVAAITTWTTTESKFSITATDGEKFVCYVRITDTAGNVTCFGAQGATFDLTAPAISGIQNGGTYCLTQSVTVTDDNLVSVTVNGTEMTEETFTLAVNEGTTYTIVATDIAGNVTEYTVTMKTVESLGESIADLTTGNVTSDNKNTVEEVKEVVETVDAANATETEKAALKEIADKCDELLQKIEEAAAACKTENIVKVDQITSDNVTPDDKENLVAAKEDLQNALEQYDGNLTSAEKAAIESKIASIDNALDAIDKAENPEGLSGGAIAGIVIGSVLGALLIAYGVCALLYKKKIVKGAFFEKIYPFVK